MPQHVVVREYNPEWMWMYQCEKRIIRDILSDNATAIYHIGSTSVPGLAAKPIIDILVAVKSLSGADKASSLFAEAGYEWMGEYRIPGRRYLRKGGDERSHQIHIFQSDDWENIVRHIAFRSYLEKHEDVRAAYSALKKTLACRFPYDIDSYSDGKDSFVRRVEALSLAEYCDTWDRLFIQAASLRGERAISPYIDAGTVSAAVMTESGNVYRGVCIDTACSLGMCAERSAIASMIASGESRIVKLAVVMGDGNAGLPCCACRELMMQLSPESRDIEILTDYEKKTTVRLGELVNKWWGSEKR